MITSKIPVSWRDLQIEVARVLHESCFNVEIEKKLKSARGCVEIDVYSEEKVHGRPYIIVCECKYWKSRVPQSVIHGFRTIVSDVGANVGYIISSNGFQRGAFNASEYTNIKLMTWGEFQDEFEFTWVTKFFIPKITEKLDPLFTYIEPIYPAWFSSLSDDKQQEFCLLKSKYDAFGALMFRLSKWGNICADEYPTLPLGRYFYEKNKENALLRDVPSEILCIESHREFLRESLKIGIEAIKKFRSFKPPV